jgi:lincosamide nucleotidyltransferase
MLAQSLPQHEMIETLRRLCREDSRLEAAMLYGSFAYGEADEFSDIDVILYFSDDMLKDVDQRAWVAQIRPVEVFYVNEFGNRVAIFDNLVRAEFHFDPVSHMSNLDALRGVIWFPTDDVILLDRHGKLAPHLQLLNEKPAHDTDATREHLSNEFFNWFLFGVNVLARGEYARAVEILHIVQDQLLRMARLDEHQTRHWMTPTRALEHEISTEVYTRYAQTHPTLDKRALWSAYRTAWQWGKSWIQKYGTNHDNLITKLEKHLTEHTPSTEN